ncbi:hypothetical protein [Rhodococcus sp. OK302]|nr:hypothetical protein [Rhodococcus sp. OK302]OYD61283.1 hypothetical protein BDB13_6252 [Rhodococcus sp. OK302]
MSTDHSYKITTIELGPYNDLSELVSDLANHALNRTGESGDLLI